MSGVLPPATAEVKQFYVSDDIGKIMSGARDYFSVGLEGKKVCEGGCFLGCCVVWYGRSLLW